MAIVKHIPNFLTLGNLLAGCISIHLIYNDEPFGVLGLLILALILDFLDGFMARILNSYSTLGKELDSLADMVSFGVVPSLMMLQLFPNDCHPWRYLAFVIAISACLRLARFNINHQPLDTGFQGLPTPAMTIAVFGLFAHYHWHGGGDHPFSFLYSPISLIAITILMSLLMMSRLSLISIKSISQGRMGPSQILLILLLPICTVWLGALGLSLFISLYILLSLSTNLIRY